MAKHSKTMPKGEARPLGTKRERKSSSKPVSRNASLVETFDERNARIKREMEEAHEDETPVSDNVREQLQNFVDDRYQDEVTSEVAMTPTSSVGDTTMRVDLKGVSKNGKTATYVGARQSLRIPVSVFADGVAPQYFELHGAFAGPKPPKVKLTAEEKKALRAEQPKLTLQQKIEKREAQLQKMREKAAKQAEKDAAALVTA